MNAWRWSWVLLAAVSVAAPGCLLVQPLDDVSADSAGASGKFSTGGSTSGAGKGGASTTPSGGKAGSGSLPSGGRGGATSASGGRGGAPFESGGRGGAPTKADLSYFTGDWTVTSGTITTDCGSGPTDTDADAGTVDTLSLGTISDMIVDKGTQCPVLIDLYDDLSAVGQDGQTCDFTNSNGTFHLDISFYGFIVSDDHQTAASDLTSVVTLTKNGVTTTCDSDQMLYYTR